MSAAVAPRHRPSALAQREPRQPDWNTFYKNGLPKEVIVIEDSPDPTANHASSRPALPASATESGLSSARKRKIAERSEAGSVGNSTTNGSNIYSSQSEANLGRKRRRVEDDHHGSQTSSQSLATTKRPKYDEYKPPRGPYRRTMNANIRVVHDVCDKETHNTITRANL